MQHTTGTTNIISPRIQSDPMSTLLPAFKVKFGSLEYYITHMPVSDLAARAKFPSEMPGWDDESIETRIQRKLNINRVKKDIAPYFANNADRFSGAIVLAVLNDDKGINFQHKEMFKDLDEFYKDSAKTIGFIVLDGSETMVPIDGQHRIKAFKFAIDGIDEKGKQLPNVPSNIELSSDNVAVIMVPFKSGVARRIFNKINRYAKPTTKGDNLIIDDDDQLAVACRKLLDSNGVIPSKLVNIDSNTLNQKTGEFTTLSTFYESTKTLLFSLCATDMRKVDDITDKQMRIYIKDLRKEWKGLLSNVSLWRQAIADPKKSGDTTRQSIRAQSLLGKPIGQWALVTGYSLARRRDNSLKSAYLYKMINKINWDINNKDWEGILVQPSGRMMSGKSTVAAAGEVIAYMIGLKLDRSGKKALVEKLHGPDSGKSLPKPAVAV